MKRGKSKLGDGLSCRYRVYRVCIYCKCRVDVADGVVRMATGKCRLCGQITANRFSKLQ